MEENKPEPLSIPDVYQALIAAKNRLFLGDKGLSITEAEHKANLLKDLAERVSAKFDGTDAYTATLIAFKGKDVSLDMNDIIELEEEATKEGTYYALSAWLREGIKAKTNVLEILQQLPAEMFGKDLIPAPFIVERPQMKYPDAPQTYTEDDIIGGFNVAERTEYLSLEAKAAHLGMKLHAKGKLSIILKQLQKGKVTGYKALPMPGGEETFLVNYRQLYKLADIEALYEKLQEQHREYNKKLNYFKATIKNGVTAANANAQAAWRLELQTNQEAYQLLLNDYNDKYQVWVSAKQSANSALEKIRLDVIKYVSQLKIIIPNEHVELLNTLKAKSEA